MKNLLYVLFALLVKSSCAPNMYIPNQQNIPAFEKKGEITVNVSRSNLGYDYQAAYALTPKIAILTSGCYFKEEFKNDQISNVPGNGWGHEFGSGYFKKSNNLVFENYGFIGFGQIVNEQGFFNNLVFQPLGHLSSSFFRIANQTSLTYTKTSIQISLSNRFSYMHYYNINDSIYVFNEIDMTQYLKSSPNSFFVEPALNIRAGIKNLKIQFQFQRCFALNKIPSISHYQYVNTSAYLGLFFKI